MRPNPDCRKMDDLRWKCSIEIFGWLLNDSTKWWENFGSGSVIGYDGTQAFTGKAFGTGSADRVRGTDAIVIIKGGGPDYKIVQHVPTSAQFKLNKLHNLKDGGIVMICDSQQTSILQLTNVNESDVTIAHNTGDSVSPGNCTKGLGYPVPSPCTTNGTPYTYGPDSTMVDFIPTAFYIGVSTSGTSKSLYQIQLEVTDPGGVASMVAQELVEGVQDMQIFYGEDTNNGDGMVKVDPPYKDATNITNWGNVLSVRVNLLTTSLKDNLGTARQTVIFPADTGNANTSGNIYTPTSTADRRLRQVFSSTIGIRNRLQIKEIK